MPLAATWMDVVVGLDLHLEMVPMPAPTPIPFPHPFVGVIFDPVGHIIGELTTAAIDWAMGNEPVPTGPVLINGMMAAISGDEVSCPIPHFIIPPGVGWAPDPGPPTSDAMLPFGSQTVSVMGTSPVRLGDVALSCSDPVRLPTSMVVAISKGKPVNIGGPPGINWQMVAMAVGGKALRNKWTAGKLHGLVRRVLPSKTPARLRGLVHKGACFLTGHPVNVANGCVLTDAVEFELPGPIPLRFERQYGSNWVDRDGPLGHGWQHSFNQCLWLEPGQVVYLTPDGREVEFDTFGFPNRAMRAGDEVYDPIECLTLRASGTLRWEIESSDGLVREFKAIAGESPEGKDRGLVKITSLRNRTSDQVRFLYGIEAELREIVDSVGRSIRFENDRDGRLCRLWLPTDDDGQRLHVQYRYSNEGDLVEVRDAMDRPMHFEYEGHLLVRECNRNSLSFYFQYDRHDRFARCIRTWGDGGIYDHEILYDRKNRRTQVVNSLGHATVYEMNLLGLVTKVTNAQGDGTNFDYDAQMRKVSEVDPLGGATRWTYNERGDCTMIVGPDKAVTKVEYNAQSNPVRAYDAMRGKWEWEYDSHCRVTSRTNPLGARTAYIYEHGAAPTAVVDPAGHRTHFEYDTHHNLARVTLPSGGYHEFRHDGLGRRIESSSDGLAKTTWRFDVLGQLTREECADGDVREFEHDAQGNTTRVRSRKQDVRFEYAGASRLHRRTECGTELSFHYNTEGQLLGISNELGHSYRFELDATGAVHTEHGFDKSERTYERDAAGRVTTIWRPQQRSTVYAYDPAGRVTHVKYHDGTTETYAYREDGQLVEAANDTVRVRFERDILGRIVREQRGDYWIASQHDHTDRRVGVTSSLGAHQSVLRSALGEVEAVAYGSDENFNPRAWDVRIERDSQGREVARQLPGAVDIRWVRDSVGRSIQHYVATESGSLRDRKYTWDFGDQLRQDVDSARGVTLYAHDALGRLAWSKSPEGEVVFRSPDSVGNLHRDEARRDRSYGSAGELKHSRGPDGSTEFEHDLEGNLVRKTSPDGTQWCYEWNAAGMLCRVVRPDNTIVDLEYDTLGRRTSKTSRGRRTCFVWDGNHLMHQWDEGAKLPQPDVPHDRQIQAFSEQRASLVELGLALHDDPLPWTLSEPDPVEIDGRLVTWVFDPDTFSPMAKLVGDRRLTIVTDIIGTPLAMLDTDGRRVCSMELNIYGEVDSARGDVAACPFRFSGQYDDADLGLYYNRFRYYSPTEGIYISQDPLRVVGGVMLGGYAWSGNIPARWEDQMYGGGSTLTGYVGDPLSLVDPLGLVRIHTEGGVSIDAYAGPEAGGVEHKPLHAHVRDTGGKQKGKKGPARTRVLMEDYYKNGQFVALRGDVMPGDPTMTKNMKKVVRNNADDLARTTKAVFDTGNCG